MPWLTGVFGLLVALSLLLRARQIAAGKVPQIRYTALWIPLALVLGLAVIHLVLSPVPYSSLLFIVHLVMAGVLYLLLLDPEVIDPVVPVLVWTGALVSWVVVEKLILGVPSPAGPFSNPNYLATVLLTSLAWCLGQVISEKQSGKQPHKPPNKQLNIPSADRLVYQLGSRAKEQPGWKRALFLAAAMASTTALVVIGSRSAGLAILGLWVVLFVFSKGRMKLIAVCMVALVLLVPTTLKHRVSEGYKQDPHAFSRLLIWKGALEMGLDHPLLGVGPNLYYEYSSKYAFPTDKLPVRYGRIARKPHNEYLKAWAEGGVVGVVALLGLLLITSRHFLGAWLLGRPGPAMAVAVLLFQALFHDLTEVFALTALGAFWLSELSRGEARTLEIDSPSRKGMLIFAGSMLLLMTLWLNLDVSARVLWQKGQRLMADDKALAAQVLNRGHALSPLHPGLARDLAGAELSGYLVGGTEDDLSSARIAISEAYDLNRMDTVPLRMEADLLAHTAARYPEEAREYLGAARRKLEKALEIEPFNALIMLRLGEILLDLGKVEAALKYVAASLEAEPNYLKAHHLRISLLEELDPGAVDLANRELEQALASLDGYSPLSVYEKIITR